MPAVGSQGCSEGGYSNGAHKTQNGAIHAAMQSDEFETLLQQVSNLSTPFTMKQHRLFLLELLK